MIIRYHPVILVLILYKIAWVLNTIRDGHLCDSYLRVVSKHSFHSSSGGYIPSVFKLFPSVDLFGFFSRRWPLIRNLSMKGELICTVAEVSPTWITNQCNLMFYSDMLYF